MRLHQLFLLTAVMSVAFAQPPAGPGGRQAGPPPGRGPMAGHPGRMGNPMMKPKFDHIKEYLGLTDANLQAVQQAISKNQNNLAGLHEQFAAKQKTVQTLLESGSSEASVIGKAVLEADAVRKQIRKESEGLRAAVLAVLTDAQKAKLNALEEAAKLRPAIEEAHGLFLLIPAEGAGPMMGGPGGPGGGPGGPGQRRMGPGGPGGRPGPGPMGGGPRRGPGGEEDDDEQ